MCARIQVRRAVQVSSSPLTIPPAAHHYWTVKHSPAAWNCRAQTYNFCIINHTPVSSSTLAPTAKSLVGRFQFFNCPNPSDVATKLRNDVVVFINYPSAINNVIARSVFQFEFFAHLRLQVYLWASWAQETI